MASKGNFIISGMDKIEAELIRELRMLLQNWAKGYNVHCQPATRLRPVDSDTLDILSYRILRLLKTLLLAEVALEDDGFAIVQKPR